MMDSGKGNLDSDQCLLQAQAHIWNHTFNLINSMSLKCAIELGIPELIHNHAKPMTLPDLIAALPMIHPTKTQHVYRLMRILSHSGFFAHQKFGHDQQGYVLTPASHLLLRNNPYSLSQFIRLILDPCMTAPWQHMSSWFQNDDITPFKTANGMPIWSYTAQNPKFGSFFNEAMASDTLLVVKVVTEKCKHMFEGMNTLVDVGGGTGTMAKGIANTFPDLECTVLDLPHVIAGLERTKNLKFIGGDMFEAVPPANAILLKWIMHDWSDEDCMKILNNCKKAIIGSSRGGKVIIIDMVVEEQTKDKEFLETQLFLDMEVMALYSSIERTEKEWAKLFSSAGFSNYKITPILGLRSIIELYP